MIDPKNSDHDETEQIVQERQSQLEQRGKFAVFGRLSVSSTMMVTITAMTPSLNASTLPMPMSSSHLIDERTNGRNRDADLIPRLQCKRVGRNNARSRQQETTARKTIVAVKIFNQLQPDRA